MDLVLELFRFLKSKKKIWLFPLILIMLLLGALLIAANGTVFAPFIYTLF